VGSILLYISRVHSIFVIDEHEVVQLTHTQVKNQEGLLLCYIKSLTSHVEKLKNSSELEFYSSTKSLE